MDELYYNDVEMGVEVINGRGVVVLDRFNTKVTTKNNLLEKALYTGDATNIDLETLYKAINSDNQNLKESCEEGLSYFYANSSNFSTPFNGKVDHFFSTSENNLPLHGGVDEDGNITFYSFAGERSDGGRYAILGAPIENLTTDMKDSTTNLFKWLSYNEDSSNIYDKNLTIVANSGAKNSLENWLSNNSITTHWNITEDTSLIQKGEFDIYIAKRERSNLYKEALSKQKGVIIFDAPTWEQMSYMGVSYTVWKEVNGSWDSIENVCNRALEKLILKRENILRSINNLEDGKLDIEYSDLTPYWHPIGINKITNKDLDTELFDGINALRDYIRKIDQEDINLFDNNLTGDRFYKLALLIGDKYRQNIQYPMSVDSNDFASFYRAYYSDASVSYARENNKYQPDLGDFTPNLSELLQAPTTSKTITITPKRFDGWTATGLYAIPGKTITIKRLDTNNNIDVKLKFNMLRANTTRMWEPNHYTRPRFMESSFITLLPEKSYQLSTPYGGPIYLYTSGIEDTQSTIEISFKDIGEHPSFITTNTSFDSNKISEYYQNLKDSIYNWTDIKTPFVEIHSIKQQQLDAFNDQHYNGDLELYFYDLKKYLVETVLNTAGYQGDGLELDSDVVQWCNDNNLDYASTIHQKPKIQHINSDIHAACGGACSGNPFDMSEPVTIFSGGAIHEYGHNLQRYLLEFYGSYSTEVTNNIFTQHVAIKYQSDQNQTVGHYKWNNYSKAYSILQKAIREDIEPKENVHPMWLDTEVHQDADIRQVLISHIAFLNQNWNVYTKLYLMERIFRDAYTSEEKWDAVKDNLGFDTYSYTEAKEVDSRDNIIGGNDFMVITLSKILNKDYREFFKAWGLRISDKASQQLDSTNYTESVKAEFFLFRDDHDLVIDMPTKSLPIDGADLLSSLTIDELCTGTTLEECKDKALIYDFDDANLTFHSIFQDNGTTDSIGENGITLIAKAKDENNEEISVSINVAVDDTITADKTSLVAWIAKENNSDLDDSKSYTINYDDVPYIEIDSNGKAINRIKIRVDLANLKSN
jgi:hypothetical protein